MNLNRTIKVLAALFAVALVLVVQGCSLALPEEAVSDEFIADWEIGNLWGVWLLLEEDYSNSFEADG